MTQRQDLLVADLPENGPVCGIYLVKDKNNGSTRAGKPYLALNLCDRTGTVKARVWDNAEQLGALFEAGDIIRVSGSAVKYQGQMQVNIRAVEACTIGEDEIQNFIPAAGIDPDLLFRQLQEHIAGIGDTHLRALLDQLFGDEALARAFKTAPAAKSIHHDYLGGLLEHTLQVATLARTIAPLYPQVNRDLLLTGAILHDIGKISELEFERGFTYSDEGRLVGHISIGMEMISRAIDKIPEFPERLALLVKHMMLSHHGQYEYGSPRRPKTPEAFMLAMLDDLDAKMFSILDTIKKDRQERSPWTSYNRLFERYFYTDSGLPDPEQDNA